MNDQKQFYEGRHAMQTYVYGGSIYNIKALLGLKALRTWLSKAEQKPIKILDVGCGKGIFLRDFVNSIRNKWDIRLSEVQGIDIVQSTTTYFSEIHGDFKFQQMNVDGQTLPLPDKHFDFVCCNHVLEHIFETEKLVREFHRVLRPDGLCLISVPNAACWYNRILFLFASQPVSTEIGTEKSTYGLWPPFLQKRAEAWQPSGHIRSFTPRGFRDLVEHCGFQAVGWWKQGTNFKARLGKWAGLEMGLLLRKKSE